MTKNTLKPSRQRKKKSLFVLKRAAQAIKKEEHAEKSQAG